jgi:hypothetical protein
MKMSHMIADTEEELHAMADKLKLKRAWYQGDHYDVSKGVRGMAIAYGAKEVSIRELVAICFCKRAGWPYKSPNDALMKMLGTMGDDRNENDDGPVRKAGSNGGGRRAQRMGHPRSKGSHSRGA